MDIRNKKEWTKKDNLMDPNDMTKEQKLYNDLCDLIMVTTIKGKYNMALKVVEVSDWSIECEQDMQQRKVKIAGLIDEITGGYKPNKCIDLLELIKKDNASCLQSALWSLQAEAMQAFGKDIPITSNGVIIRSASQVTNALAGYKYAIELLQASIEQHKALLASKTAKAITLSPQQQIACERIKETLQKYGIDNDTIKKFLSMYPSMKPREFKRWFDAHLKGCIPLTEFHSMCTEYANKEKRGWTIQNVSRF